MIATVAHPVDRPSHIPTESLPSFRPSPPWASTWAILVVYAPRYREVITAMPTKAHRGAAMMRHVADIKSTHSSNDCEHQRRPLDVIMTTQPSSRRRLAEGARSVVRSGICRRESSPSSRTIDSTLVGDVGLVRESRARVGPMHCDHLGSSTLLAEEAHPGRTGIVGTF